MAFIMSPDAINEEEEEDNRIVVFDANDAEETVALGTSSVVVDGSDSSSGSGNDTLS